MAQQAIMQAGANNKTVKRFASLNRSRAFREKNAMFPLEGFRLVSDAVRSGIRLGALLLTENAAEGFRLTGEVTGFQLAGADGVFYPAAASFAPNRITLTAEAVPRPEYARYAWTNYLAPVTVFGMNGLPLAPFRTDSFGAQTAENTEKRNAPSASAE